MVKVKNSSRPTRDAYGEEILALGGRTRTFMLWIVTSANPARPFLCKKIAPSACKCWHCGTECLRHGSRFGHLWENSFCNYLCCIWQYENV